MESNSNKNGGFGLIEVIISMAIIGIISVSVYTSYIMTIKHTKEGQVKQATALEGKKIIEEIKSTDIQLPTSDSTDSTININGRIVLQEDPDTGTYRRYLDDSYKDVSSDMNEASRKYTEIVTIARTKTITNEEVKLENGECNLNNNDINYKVNISKEKLPDNTVKDYIFENASKKVELEGQNKIILYMYIEDGNNSRTITIKNFKGKQLLKNNLPLNDSLGKVNIFFNFNEYKQLDKSVTKPVLINVYNKTNADIPNIYLEKSKQVSADVQAFQGKINFYDNRAENQNEATSSTLYDIKVEIRDYIKNRDYEASHDVGQTWEDKDNLFTAYYKQNIE